MKRQDRWLTWLIVLGGGVNSLYKGCVAPLLPLLIERYDLTLSGAGSLASVLQFSASISQLLWGRAGDRFGRRVLLIIGPSLVGVAFSLIGLARDRTTLSLALLLTGFASGLFPPQATAVLGRAQAPERLGFDIGISFMVGIVGLALGPLITIPLISALGLGRLYMMALFGFAVSIGLASYSGLIREDAVATRRSRAQRGSGPQRSVFILVAISALRAFGSVGFTTFISVFCHSRGMGVFTSGVCYSIYMLAGAVGAFVGPRLAMRYGTRPVMLVSLLLTPVFCGGFVLSGDLLSFCFLGLAGASLYLSVTPSVALAIELAPGQAGTVSALTTGVAWGVGSAGAVAVGYVAQRTGIGTAMVLAGGATLAAAMLVPFVPRLATLRAVE